MTTKLKTIKLGPSATDEDVEGKYKEEIDSDNFESVSWIIPDNNVRTWPPEKTAAIVVNIHKDRGAVNVYETPGDKFIGGVGSEDAESLVMIPWNERWWYYSIGSLRVGYIKKKK